MSRYASSPKTCVRPTQSQAQPVGGYKCFKSVGRRSFVVVVGHGVGVLWSAMTMPFASIEDYTAPEPKELHGGRWLGGGVCYKQLTDRSRIANSTSGGNQRDDTFQRGPRSALPLLRPPRMPFAFLQRAKSPRPDHGTPSAAHGTACFQRSLNAFFSKT